jgi:hypothetical protein
VTVYTYETESALHALPVGAKVLDSTGEVWAKYRPRIYRAGLAWRNTSNVYNRTGGQLIRSLGSLTLVWRPCWCAWQDQAGHTDDCERNT